MSISAQVDLGWLTELRNSRGEWTRGGPEPAPGTYLQFFHGTRPEIARKIASEGLHAHSYTPQDPTITPDSNEAALVAYEHNTDLEWPSKAAALVDIRIPRDREDEFLHPLRSHMGYRALKKSLPPEFIRAYKPAVGYTHADRVSLGQIEQSISGQAAIELAFNPAEPRDKAGRWFHGTVDDYKPGDLIEHYYWKKYPDRSDFRENTPLYTTTDPSLAAHRADELERMSFGQSKGHLYEVQPTGSLRPDEVANPTIKGATSWEATSPLQVIREIPRNEWPKNLSAWQIEASNDISTRAIGLGWHFDPAELRDVHGKWTKNGAAYAVPEHARLINPRGRPPDPADHPWLKANPVSPANILKVYDLSTPAEKAQGMRWYADAHDVAADMAGGDAVKGAGLLASYSPQTSWPMNMFNAARAAKEGRALGPGDGMITGDMQRNAQEVLDGMPLDQALPSPKINSFAHLIQHGGDEPGDTTGQIVIDRHALSAAVGRRLTKAELDKAPLQHQNIYQYIADQYRLAAAELARRGEHIAPHQLQAITWLHQQTANEAEDAANALEKVGRLARGRKVSLGRAWENWMKYAAGHGIETDRGTTSLSGQLAATELAWHFDPLQPRGPDGKWEKRAQVIGPATVQAEQLRARQHAARRAKGATWTVDENGKIIRGAHPGIHGQAAVQPDAGPLTAESARARQLRAEGMGPESIRDQLDFERNQAREAAKLEAEKGRLKAQEGVWQFLGPHGDLKSKVGREPAKGDIARLIVPGGGEMYGVPLKIIVGRVIAKAGGHAAVDAEDGNRHLIDWRNGGQPVHIIPLSQVGPALPGLGHPVVKAQPDQLARFRAAQAGELPPHNDLLGSPLPAGALFRPGKLTQAAAGQLNSLGAQLRVSGIKPPSLPDDQALQQAAEPVTELGHASTPVQRLKALIPAVQEGGVRSDPGGQGVQGVTDLVTLPDGTKVIVKQGESKDRADREELSYYVSQAIGAGAPALARIPGTGGRGLIEDVVPGKTAERLDTDGEDPSADYELMHTPEAKQIGLLDTLISNSDRHEGNWLVSPEGKPVPIDHGQAQFDNYAWYSQFWLGRENWSQEELEQITSQLQKTQTEFARTGHLDWYQNMMKMMRRIQSGQDFSISGQAGIVDLGNRPLNCSVDRDMTTMTISGQASVDLSYNPAELRDSHGRWTRSGQSRAADVMMKNREGFSVSVQTGGEPASGYMVARTGHTHIFPESVLRDHARLTRAIDQMIMSEHGSLGDGIYLGGWVHDGKLWLEPSDNFADQEQAAAAGRERNQIAIWDVSQGQEIQTGGTGGGHITEHDASGRPVRVYTESPGQGSG